MDFDIHNALELPKRERVAYLKVVASLAAADGRIGATEQDLIRTACRDFELNAQETDEVVRAAADPEQAEILDTVETLRESPLRFTLLADMTHVAHADGRYTREERTEIVEISQILGTTYAELAAIDRRVEAERKAARSPKGGHEPRGFGTHVGGGAGLKSYLGITWLAGKLKR